VTNKFRLVTLKHPIVAGVIVSSVEKLLDKFLQ
jgi:hypothetical protein